MSFYWTLIFPKKNIPLFTITPYSCLVFGSNYFQGWSPWRAKYLMTTLESSLRVATTSIAPDSDAFISCWPLLLFIIKIIIIITQIHYLYQWSLTSDLPNFFCSFAILIVSVVYVWPKTNPLLPMKVKRLNTPGLDLMSVFFCWPSLVWENVFLLSIPVKSVIRTERHCD